MLLVHLRQKQIKLKEMEIFVLGSLNEHNGKQLNSSLEAYRRMVFPGQKGEESGDRQMELAKKLLAEEAKKVLLVRPLPKGAPPVGYSHKDMNRLAARAVADQEKERLKELRSRRARAHRAALKQRRRGR